MVINWDKHCEGKEQGLHLSSQVSNSGAGPLTLTHPAGLNININLKPADSVTESVFE